MIITTKISFKEYIKLIYSLAYERIALKLLVGVAFILFLWIVLYNLAVFNLPKPLIYQYINFFLIAIGQPLVIFLTTRSNYYSSNHLQENLQMEMTPDKIKITGESYYMEVKWDKLFKIIEKPNWFLMYQNNLSAILVRKRDMCEREINQLREILNNLNNVPVKL